ncbi:MAG: hypothetical protein RL710_3383, partial [Pseudomonadota bacterium]
QKTCVVAKVGLICLEYDIVLNHTRNRTNRVLSGVDFSR